MSSSGKKELLIKSYEEKIEVLDRVIDKLSKETQRAVKDECPSHFIDHLKRQQDFFITEFSHFRQFVKELKELD